MHSVLSIIRKKGGEGFHGKLRNMDNPKYILYWTKNKIKSAIYLLSTWYIRSLCLLLRKQYVIIVCLRDFVVEIKKNHFPPSSLVINSLDLARIIHVRISETARCIFYFGLEESAITWFTCDKYRMDFFVLRDWRDRGIFLSMSGWQTSQHNCAWLHATPRPPWSIQLPLYFAATTATTTTTATTSLLFSQVRAESSRVQSPPPILLSLSHPLFLRIVPVSAALPPTYLLSHPQPS